MKSLESEGNMAKAYFDETQHQSIYHEIATDIADIVQRKNADYGASYEKVRAKYRDTLLIHLTEKLMRLEQLQYEPAQVSESIEDTLKDIAGYCLLELSLQERDCKTSWKGENNVHNERLSKQI